MYGRAQYIQYYTIYIYMNMQNGELRWRTYDRLSPRFRSHCITEIYAQSRVSSTHHITINILGRQLVMHYNTPAMLYSSIIVKFVGGVIITYKTIK